MWASRVSITVWNMERSRLYIIAYAIMNSMENLHFDKRKLFLKFFFWNLKTLGNGISCILENNFIYKIWRDEHAIKILRIQRFSGHSMFNSLTVIVQLILYSRSLELKYKVRLSGTINIHDRLNWKCVLCFG